MKSCEFYSRVREKLCASTYKSIAKVCCVHSHGRDRVINVSRFSLITDCLYTYSQPLFCITLAHLCSLPPEISAYGARVCRFFRARARETSCVRALLSPTARVIIPREAVCARVGEWKHIYIYVCVFVYTEVVYRRLMASLWS